MPISRADDQTQEEESQPEPEVEKVQQEEQPELEEVRQPIEEQPIMVVVVKMKCGDDFRMFKCPGSYMELKNKLQHIYQLVEPVVKYKDTGTFLSLVK